MTIGLKELQYTLFLDIETVSGYATFDEMPEGLKPLWIRKAKSLDHSLVISDHSAVAAMYQQRAAIYAEFGRIVCISLGFLSSKGILRVKTITNHDEKIILMELYEILEKHYYDIKKHKIAGHNIREFDVPYICRRMLINELKLPRIFDIMSKKPWQTEHFLDTMDLWRFGDYKSYTSLNLICNVLNIESPKTDLDGSMVGKAYWEENRLADIAKYCAQDVVAVVRIIFRLCAIQLEEEMPVEFVGEEE